MDNYIVVNPSGNTYFGPLAHDVLYKRVKLGPYFKLDADERFFVYEFIDGRAILRAGCNTQEKAMRYMGPNRLMIWEEA